MREFVPLVREAARQNRESNRDSTHRRGARKRRLAVAVERSVRVNEPNALDFSHEVCAAASKRF